MASGKILIVEDGADFRTSVREFLTSKGYEVYEAGSCQATLNVLRSIIPDVVVTDYSLPDGNALELIPRLKRIDPNLCFLVLSEYGTIDLAVQTIKAGAEQFLTKPVEPSSFLAVLQQSLENRRNQKKQLVTQSQKCRRPLDPFLGVSQAIRAVAKKAQKLLSTETSILIQGETGTGKGVLAAWLHYHSPRREEPLIELNCAALSWEFLETELFGHERGSFTGAVTSKMGLFEVAHGGTVFLDEIGDMDLQVQPKLLKVLEEKRFRRLGDIRERLVDVRLITATHKDLGLLARENKFRNDLYFRINILSLKLPPLRERIEDIPILARHISSELADDLGCGDFALSQDLEKSLQAYRWPGNIRELRNALERALLLRENHILTSKDLHLEHLSDATPVSRNQILTLSELEHRHIEKVLLIEQGRVEEAAKKLGLSRSALYERIKKHGITMSGIHNGKS